MEQKIQAVFQLILEVEEMGVRLQQQHEEEEDQKVERTGELNTRSLDHDLAPLWIQQW